MSQTSLHLFYVNLCLLKVFLLDMERKVYENKNILFPIDTKCRNKSSQKTI